MPKFNVHLFYEYRVKFNDIEAETPEAALNIAMDRMPCEADDGPEFAEGLATTGIVDPLLDDGEPDLDNSENFVMADIVPRKQTDWQKQPLAL